MRGLSTLILLAACAAALVACGGSAENLSTVSPTPSAPGSRSASGSASASPTAAPTQTGPLLTGHGVSPGEVPPTRSNFSLQHSSDGALAFAAYFYRAADWSVATSNAYLLRQVSARACDACYQIINDIDTVSAAGGYSVGGRITASSFTLVQGGGSASSQFLVEVVVSQQSQVLVASSGAAPATHVDNGKPATTFLHLEWTGQGWQVADISHA